ncbi:glyoxalase [Rhizobium leguminosarum bv. trifolii CB782]|nr:glyoxalase [Rhizobium leguminosarum bv. trifolii CB782]
MNEDPDRIEVLPVLPSLDINETLSFYRDKLGFANIVYEAPDYLILRRDDMELHFWRTEDVSLCEKTSVYLRGGIGALHAEYREKGVERLTEMEVRPWNMEEFYIHDPHGNLLRFGRIPQPRD